MRSVAGPGRLHVLTDVVLQHRYGHADLARMALEGGADVIQFRDKRPLSGDERLRLGESVGKAAASAGKAWIVNDDVEVARRLGATGVHLGAADSPVSTARELLGQGAWIGSTANGLEQARRRSIPEIDYLGVGPVFGTSSKTRPAPALGLDGLRRIVAAVDRPVIAIGNITPANVEAVLATGVHGVAVLGAVVLADDPAAETRRLRAAIDRVVAVRAEVCR